MIRSAPLLLAMAISLSTWGCSTSSTPGDISGTPDLTDTRSSGDTVDAVTDSSLPADVNEVDLLDLRPDESQDIPVILVEMQAIIDTQPFGVRFIQNGTVLTRLDSPDGALAIKGTDGTKILLVGEPTVEELGQKTTLTYKTQDGRTATVVVQPVENGGWEVRFDVPEKVRAERFLVDLKVSPFEGFYGLMERVVQGPQEKSWKEGMTEGLNLRGQKVELLVVSTLSAYSPFFLSSRGWGLFVDSNWPGVYDLCQAENDRVSLSYEGDSLRMVVFPGPTPEDVTKRYSQTVGTTLLPPAWTFQPWRWRDDVWPLAEYYDGTPATSPYNSMITEDILLMEWFGIPCSLYWVDRPWGPGDFGYGDLEWDPVRLPNPREMVQWINGRGMQFMLWIAPWAVGDQMAQECVAEKYQITNPIPAGAHGGYLLDLTNPASVDWWQEYLKKPMADNVVGFKLDRGEEMVPDGVLFSGKTYDGTDYRELRNNYPALYAKAVHDAFVEFGMEEFVVMPRSGWKTSSQYAIVWGGDTAPTEYGLRSAIIAVQRSAVMNFPIWGSDTCGYGQNPPHELCMRWLAFSAFTPLMEVGPTDNVAFWSWKEDGQAGSVSGSGYSYEPFYDEDLIAAWIFYSNLHNDLSDYLYEEAKKAHGDGTPIVRPLFFANPDNAAYLDQFDQFFLGPDIMVAPIWKSGVTERDVMIPVGDWTDAWTLETIEGPVTVTTNAAKHKIPIYLRTGSTLNLGDLEQKWQDALTKAADKPDLELLEAGAEF